MSDGGALDQNEIERLLGGGGSGGGVMPSADPAPVADSGILSQEELNALFGNVAASPLPPPPLAMPSSIPPVFSASSESVPSSAPPVFGSGWGDTSAVPFGTVSSESEDEDEEGILHGDLDYLAKRAEDSLRSIAAEPMTLPTEVIEFQFPEFGGAVPGSEHTTLDLISDVDLNVKVELGRTHMYIEDVLKLRRGSVVSLDKMAGEPVDIYINGRLIARGEVLVMNENFCVRVVELLAGATPME